MLAPSAKFFHLFFLDDNLGGKGAPHPRTIRSAIRKFILNEPDVDADEPFDAIDAQFAQKPSELLAGVRSVLGRHPVAAVIDCDLRDCGERDYTHEGGGFGLWAKLAQDGRDLPPYLAPFVVIFSAKPEIYQIYAMVQPGPGQGWIAKKMQPLVIQFDAEMSERPTPLIKLLSEWIEETRSRFLRSCSARRLRELRKLAQEGDWRTAWRTEVEFDIADDVQWKGSLAALFPKRWGQLKAGTSPEQVRREVLRDLAVSVPDATTLVRRFLTEPRSQLEQEPRFVELQNLRGKLNSVSHLAADHHEAVPVVAKIAQQLQSELEETLQATQLDCRYRAHPKTLNRATYPPDGILAFLANVAATTSAEALEKLIDTVGKPHFAGRCASTTIPHPFRELEALSPGLLEKCNRGLDGAGLCHLPVKEPWKEFLRYFPLTLETCKVITTVIDANRRKHGDGCEPIWRTAIVPYSGQSGGALTLQILAKTQGEKGEELEEEKIVASLASDMAPEQLTELRAMVCGQYDGVIRLFRGRKQIDITWDSIDHHILDDLTNTPLGDEKDLGAAGIYTPAPRFVRGTWYLIEIGSREWDE